MEPGEQSFSNQSWETRWGSMSEGDCVWVPGLGQELSSQAISC